MKPTVERQFQVKGTGHPFDTDELRYLRSMRGHGDFVWHLFEVIKKSSLALNLGLTFGGKRERIQKLISENKDMTREDAFMQVVMEDTEIVLGKQEDEKGR